MLYLLYICTSVLKNINYYKIIKILYIQNSPPSLTPTAEDTNRINIVTCKTIAGDILP